jgi:hypothetical protein
MNITKVDEISDAHSEEDEGGSPFGMLRSAAWWILTKV